MQTLSRIGRRVSKAAAVALASALAIGGVKRAREKPRTEFVPSSPDRSAGGGSRGFVATIEDRSNDRGFVAAAEDRSNDTGFVRADPARVPEADPPVPPPADLSTATEQAPSHETPHELGNPPKGT